MKLLKLAAIPMALGSTAAFAADVTVVNAPAVPVTTTTMANGTTIVDTAPVPVTATTYDSNTGLIKNSTTQIVDGTKTIFGTLFHPAAVSAEAGSLGYGANIGWGVNDRTELQVGYDGGNVGKMVGHFKVDDVKYDVKTHFKNPYVAVQMRPAANWFTVGVGTLFPKDRIDLESKGDGYVTIDKTKYKLEDNDTLKGKIKYENHIAPFATIGFHPNINNHWGVFGDIGAAYMGRTETSVTGNTLNAKIIAAKAEKELKDKDEAKWLPIAKLGVTYRF